MSLAEPARVITGDCLTVMATLEPESVHAIVCDPPYGISFMGRGWDHTVPGVPFWEAALRVATPGAHLVAFGGSRTWHRLTCAIEDAGWEVRDCLMWLYGSGFPKSLDVAKAIDRQHGHASGRAGEASSANGSMTGDNYERTDKGEAVTDAAKQWEGWHTALKPAFEPIVLARKPIRGTVSDNVQAHGTGALNIDATRIPAEGEGLGGGRVSSRSDGWDRPWKSDPAAIQAAHARGAESVAKAEALGRWPANLLLDEDSAAMLDEQAGDYGAAAPASGPTLTDPLAAGRAYGARLGVGATPPFYGDTGGASRFFYTAKAARSEREDGLEGFEPQVVNEDTPPGTAGANSPRAGAGRSGARKNHHPTVKPIDLMRWLVRLVTPPAGVVLDPFCGSGSTGCAAVLEDRLFLGIELDPANAEIARARIARHEAQLSLPLG